MVLAGTASRNLSSRRLLLSPSSRSFLSQGRHSVNSSMRLAFSGHGLDAHQPEPQSTYAVEDAVEVGLVDDLPREDRLPALGLHLHPFEGSGVSFAEFRTHDYPVDRSCGHMDPC